MRAGDSAINAERLTSRMPPNLNESRARGYNAALARETMNKPDKKETPRLIAENRRARYDYFIEERLEAGLVLQGWEVKAMRAG
jgi:hypothetical protein